MKEQSCQLLLTIFAFCTIAGFVSCDVEIEYNFKEYLPPLWEEHVNVLSKLCSCNVEKEKLASQKRECDQSNKHLKELYEREKELTERDNKSCFNELNFNKQICDLKINGLELHHERKLRIDKQNLLSLSTGWYLLSPPNKLANWFEAARACKEYGMELVSIETKEENDALLKVIGIENFWISGVDLGSEGHFYWASTGKEIGPFTYFLKDQPDNMGGDENFLHFWSRGKTEPFMWNDSKYTWKMRFICELQN
ncbi:C-type lectin 37Da-like [Neocloeon triangulifer]|uniref:C-type lectin 37Da-like n=1 Tax=Neocloeon triangulifer TaxID=2078957 RepID=UPI00286EB87E|nr:C-type lectin 37Da-like [Neocloeon triangulifer]